MGAACTSTAAADGTASKEMRSSKADDCHEVTPTPVALPLHSPRGRRASYQQESLPLPVATYPMGDLQLYQQQLAAQQQQQCYQQMQMGHELQEPYGAPPMWILPQDSYGQSDQQQTHVPQPQLEPLPPSTSGSDKSAAIPSIAAAARGGGKQPAGQSSSHSAQKMPDRGELPSSASVLRSIDYKENADFAALIKTTGSTASKMQSTDGGLDGEPDAKDGDGDFYMVTPLMSVSLSYHGAESNGFGSSMGGGSAPEKSRYAQVVRFGCRIAKPLPEAETVKLDMSDSLLDAAAEGPSATSTTPTSGAGAARPSDPQDEGSRPVKFQTPRQRRGPRVVIAETNNA